MGISWWTHTGHSACMSEKRSNQDCVREAAGCPWRVFFFSPAPLPPCASAGPDGAQCKAPPRTSMTATQPTGMPTQFHLGAWHTPLMRCSHGLQLWLCAELSWQGSGSDAVMYSAKRHIRCCKLSPAHSPLVAWVAQQLGARHVQHGRRSNYD